MLVKKSHKARLSPYRKLFFQLGLILTLLLIYVALEWKTVDRNISDFDQASIQTEEFIEIPITQRLLKVKPPPPPPAPERIEIVTNEEDIIETVLESTETDETEFIEVKEYEEIEEISHNLFVLYRTIDKLLTQAQSQHDINLIDDVVKMLRGVKCKPCPGLKSVPGCKIAKDHGCPKPDKP